MRSLLFSGLAGAIDRLTAAVVEHGMRTAQPCYKAWTATVPGHEDPVTLCCSLRVRHLGTCETTFNGVSYKVTG